MGDGATRSRIEAGWHARWGRVERRKERRRPNKLFITTDSRLHQVFMKTNFEITPGFCQNQFRDNTMVKFHLRHGLRGLQSVELELSSCEFKPAEREEMRHRD